MAQETLLNRRDFFRIGSRALAGGAAVASLVSAPRARPGFPAILKGNQQRPNVLIMMTDQQRFDSLGCYGSKAAHTPNLDRLASEGTLFETCYVSNPVCTPSRASMLTGKTVPGHGVYRLYDNLPEDEVLFTKRLQDAGYRTHLAGKLHVSGRLAEASRRHPNDGFGVYDWCVEPAIHLDSPFNGYTRWLAQEDPEFLARLRAEGRELTGIPRHLHMNYWAAERTIDAIEESTPDSPFFCLMSVFDPHDPYRGYPPEMAKLVDTSQIRDPVQPLPGQMEPEAIVQERNRSYLGKFSEFSRKEIRRMRADYHATVAFFDEQVGRVLQALERKGIAENTLTIFLSDGGDMLGDHNLLVKGSFFYDPSIRVPFLMRWPGNLPAGRRVGPIIQLQDLAATVLSAAGILNEEVQEKMPDSRDLLPLARGERSQVHDYAVCTYRNTGIADNGGYHDPPIHATMLRDETHKLNLYLRRDGPPEGQIFDMVADPSERQNLWDSPKHRDARMKLTEKLLEWETIQEIRNGSRGGGQVPAPSQRLDNRLKPKGT